MKTNIIAALAALAALQGCAVQKTLTPIGGSRADGVVRLGFTVSAFEKPVVDEQQAYRAAAQRCHAWGYSDAEAFGGRSVSCIDGGSYGCNAWQVTVEYQCTGQPEAVSAVSPAPAQTVEKAQ